MQEPQPYRIDAHGRAPAEVGPLLGLARGQAGVEVPLYIWSCGGSSRSSHKAAIQQQFFEGNFSANGDSKTTPHRSSEVGCQTMYSRDTFLAVPDTNVSYPDLPGLAASLLQSTPRRVVVNCCVLFFQTGFGKLASSRSQRCA